ncbi:Glucosidase 2 subunit beta [Pelomyxa schiedti]|nr:Glucosidase 2 subunit beta [Pelomyxa schiedti]
MGRGFAACGAGAGCVVVVAICCVCGSVLATSQLRGVAPNKRSVYEKFLESEEFTCMSGGKATTFAASRINDDYCDCTDDAFDEPGTPACSGGKFWCTNKGFVGSYISSGFVDDGFCDCCDGSDESGEGIECPNTCSQAALEAGGETLRKYTMIKDALAIKQTLANDGLQIWTEKKKTLDVVKAQSKAILNQGNEDQKEIKSKAKLTAEIPDENKKLEMELTSFMHLHLEKMPCFINLYGKCLSYQAESYVYDLCPFNKVVQRSKQDKKELSLGKWGKWINSKTTMLFSQGEKCWNGPERSTKVNLVCGIEHNVTSTEEPGRCEYSMSFTTPCACTNEMLEEEIAFLQELGVSV